MSRDLYYSAIRNDFWVFLRAVFSTLNPRKPFVDAKHIDAIIWHLEQCRTGKIRRLIITIAPRSLKSVITSIAFPLWVWTHDPSARFLCASYGQKLADRNALFAREIMQESWFQEAFPDVRLNAAKSEISNYMTTELGLRQSTSTQGVGTGFGGGFVIIDDPHKAKDAHSPETLDEVFDWYRSTIPSRLDDPNDGCIIVIMQRLAERDLAGRLLEQGGWTHLCLPAIADEAQSIEIGPDEVWERAEGDLLDKERLPLGKLDELRHEMGKADFEAQYQQRPITNSESTLQLEWILRHELLPFRSQNRTLNQRKHDHVVQSWDTAAKPSTFNKYSVCTTWLVRDDRFHLLDCYRERVDIVDLQNAYERLVSQWHPNVVLVEDCSSGTQLLQLMKGRSGRIGPRVVPILPRENKAERWYFQVRKFAEGFVQVPKQADWLATYIDELMRFPNCPYSDQVDSTSQFLRWMEAPSWPPPSDHNEQLVRRITPIPGAYISRRPINRDRNALVRRLSRSMFPSRED